MIKQIVVLAAFAAVGVNALVSTPRAFVQQLTQITPSSTITQQSTIPNSSTSLSMSSAEDESVEPNGNGGGVVVTGAAGGVGFAYAGEFMDRGYSVVIADIKDCSTAAKVLAARHPNGQVFATKCDVSDTKSVEDLGKFEEVFLYKYILDLR